MLPAVAQAFTRARACCFVLSPSMVMLPSHQVSKKFECSIWCLNSYRLQGFLKSPRRSHQGRQVMDVFRTNRYPQQSLVAFHMLGVLRLGESFSFALILNQGYSQEVLGVSARTAQGGKYPVLRTYYEAGLVPCSHSSEDKNICRVQESLVSSYIARKYWSQILNPALFNSIVRLFVTYPASFFLILLKLREKKAFDFSLQCDHLSL